MDHGVLISIICLQIMKTYRLKGSLQRPFQCLIPDRILHFIIHYALTTLTSQTHLLQPFGFYTGLERPLRSVEPGQFVRKSSTHCVKTSLHVAYPTNTSVSRAIAPLEPGSEHFLLLIYKLKETEVGLYFLNA